MPRTAASCCFTTRNRRPPACCRRSRARSSRPATRSCAWFLYRDISALPQAADGARPLLGDELTDRIAHGMCMPPEVSDCDIHKCLQRPTSELLNRKDTSNSMIPGPLLKPTLLAAKSCELRVRGTRFDCRPKSTLLTKSYR